VRVLLVDDEERFVSVLAKRLRLRGIEAEYALSADDALRAVKDRRFDVALLDVKMPGMGGIELRRQLEARAPHLRFLFVTGHGSRDDFEAGSTGGAPYVAKPIEIDDLVADLTRSGPEEESHDRT
jgi:DNA-binding NtrC family response regulator